MANTTILKFGQPVGGDSSDLPGWVVVDGKPTMKTTVQHTTKDGKVLSGTWQATPGTYHASYTDYEFVHMISGRIIITPDGGEPVEVGPGDAFVVEADFKGTWKIIERVTKHFVVTIGS
ncbi:cupin domain-containing protein [Aminobacter aminovorans]|uniref:cupin domain-containing protein n=1 Tax=Aminobacter aminovorans TaxID=83263 RepID=UPI0028654DF2|nr:cupin domain-containing protein [Aminobacter aminovorans]MDR7225326.1 putative cupin superfamily protein [Aminobacter aminovorans]